jgi:hypothetical protein
LIDHTCIAARGAAAETELISQRRSAEPLH